MTISSSVHAHFLTLDNDRLLKVYRPKVGLPAPGDDMGGWFHTKGFQEDLFWKVLILYRVL